jgi:hypothetical protein
VFEIQNHLLGKTFPDYHPSRLDSAPLMNRPPGARQVRRRRPTLLPYKGKRKDTAFVFSLAAAPSASQATSAQSFPSHEVVQQNHTSKPDLVAVARRRSLTACGLAVTKKTSWTAVPVLASAFSPVPVKYLISSLSCCLEPLVGRIRPGIIE